MTTWRTIRTETRYIPVRPREGSAGSLSGYAPRPRSPAEGSADARDPQAASSQPACD